MAEDAKKTRLVDAVFEPGRETSPVSNAIDFLLESLHSEGEVSSTMILDLIALHWIILDVLRGQGLSAETIAQMDTNPQMNVRLGE